jgi:hypothetical protein
VNDFATTRHADPPSREEKSCAAQFRVDYSRTSAAASRASSRQTEETRMPRESTTGQHQPTRHSGFQGGHGRHATEQSATKGIEAMRRKRRRFSLPRRRCATGCCRNQDRGNYVVVHQEPMGARQCSAIPGVGRHGGLSQSGTDAQRSPVTELETPRQAIGPVPVLGRPILRP